MNSDNVNWKYEYHNIIDDVRYNSDGEEYTKEQLIVTLSDKDYIEKTICIDTDDLYNIIYSVLNR